MKPRSILEAVTQRRVLETARSRWFPTWPPKGWVRFGGLRRLAPVSRSFGFDRGTPIDRWYIENFLDRHSGPPGYSAGDIRGRVLEVGDDVYARRFGGETLTQLDVLHVSDDNPQATIVDDLADPSKLEEGMFDCVICTQTLHVIYDYQAVVATLHRILRPGGVALVTFPGISPGCTPDRDLWGDFWRFTSLSARRVFEESFPAEEIRIDPYGNVLSAIAFLHGISADELKRDELELRDPRFEVVIGVRAVKR